MTTKNMVLCIYLVMGFLLYDLYFDIAWPFSPHNHYIVKVLMAILHHCLHCLCSDFINFPWPFKTFKLAGLKDLLLQLYNDNAYDAICIRL